PTGEAYHACYRCKERALAGPVRPHDGGQAAGSKLSAHGLQGHSPPIAHGHVVQQNAAVSKTTPRRSWADAQVQGRRRHPRPAGEARVVKSREVSHPKRKFTIANRGRRNENGRSNYENRRTSRVRGYVRPVAVGTIGTSLGP